MQSARDAALNRAAMERRITALEMEVRGLCPLFARRGSLVAKWWWMLLFQSIEHLAPDSGMYTGRFAVFP